MPKENMEMTRNQVCGVPLTKGEEDITMEENVGYEVCGVSPLTAGTGQEAAADIPMEENVGYGITNQVCGVFPLIAGTTMKNS